MMKRKGFQKQRKKESDLEINKLATKRVVVDACFLPKKKEESRRRQNTSFHVYKQTYIMDDRWLDDGGVCHADDI